MDISNALSLEQPGYVMSKLLQDWQWHSKGGRSDEFVLALIGELVSRQQLQKVRP